MRNLSVDRFGQDAVLLEHTSVADLAMLVAAATACVRFELSSSKNPLNPVALLLIPVYLQGTRAAVVHEAST
jgi:hypothetical protein